MTIATTLENAKKTVMGVMSPKPEGDADVMDTLHAEHREVLDLTKRLAESTDAREQKSLVAQIKKALVPHSKAEEAIVYDAVLALKDEKPRIDGAEGYTEHALASATLKQFDQLAPNTTEFKASAKVLKELLEHHIKEEENNIWSDLKDNFSDEQRVAMNRAYLAEKKTVPVS